MAKLFLSRVFADISMEMLLFVPSEYLARLLKPSCAAFITALMPIRTSINLNMLESFSMLLVNGIVSFLTRFMEPPILSAELPAFFWMLSTPTKDFLYFSAAALASVSPLYASSYSAFPNPSPFRSALYSAS